MAPASHQHNPSGQPASLQSPQNPALQTASGTAAAALAALLQASNMPPSGQALGSASSPLLLQRAQRSPAQMPRPFVDVPHFTPVHGQESQGNENLLLQILATQKQQGQILRELQEHQRALNQANVVQAIATASLTNVLANSREMTAMVFKAVVGKAKIQPFSCLLCSPSDCVGPKTKL